MASTDDLPTVPPGDPRDRQAADETPVQPNRWRVRLICCGRDDGTREAASWEEADAFREAYTSGPGVKTSPTQTSGHERAAIIEKIDPDQPDGEPLTWSLAAEMVREDAIAAEERRIELAQREGRAYDQPHVAPGPDVDAGGTGDEVYLAPARAMLAHADGDTDELFAWQNCPSCPNGVRCACSGIPYPSAAVRAAIDEARAPLLAEVERLRMVAAEMRREADAQFAIWRAEIAEARAKTDGGEWTTERGHRPPFDSAGFCTCTSLHHAYQRGASRRVWRGPVTDDGSGHA